MPVPGNRVEGDVVAQVEVAAGMGDGQVLPDEAAYREAVDRLRAAAAAYYNADVLLMDDATYDRLARSVAATEATHPQWALADSPTGQVAAGVGVVGDVPHTVPMLSLDNVFSPAELSAWADTLTKRVAKAGRTLGGFTVEPKMDGLALAARYRRGVLEQIVTRGDGTAGEDVTHAAAQIVGLPARLTRPVTVELRGEVVLTEAQFEAAQETRIAHDEPVFANPRNAAAGTLRARGRAYTIPMSFFCYGMVSLGEPVDGRDVDTLAHSAAMDLAADLGATTTAMSPAGMGRCADVAAVQAFIDSLAERRDGLGFDIDGAVVKADEAADRAAGGFSSKAPRWAIAYKWPAQEVFSILQEVLWQVGRTGVITPRARITPAVVGGVEVEYATLHNPNDLARKGFMLADTVVVKRAGEVIPRLEAPVVDLRDGSQTEIVPPVVCPNCGGDIDRSQQRWRCVRGRECGLAESIRYAISRDALDVEGMGERLVAQLVVAGLVGDVADLFTLSEADLLGLDRMGEVSAANILAQLDKARSAPLARVVTALGVRMTGRSMSRRLARHFGSMAALRAASVSELMGVDGVGAVRAATIRAELDELSEVIDKLAAAGVQAAADTGEAGAAGQDAEAGPVSMGVAVLVKPDGSPRSVCVSGTVPGLTRTEAQEAVEALGGKATGSVSKKLDLLVAGDGAGSKLAKATELGVPVMDAAEFAALVAQHLGAQDA